MEDKASPDYKPGEDNIDDSGDAEHGISYSLFCHHCLIYCVVLINRIIGYIHFTD